MLCCRSVKPNAALLKYSSRCLDAAVRPRLWLRASHGLAACADVASDRMQLWGCEGSGSGGPGQTQWWQYGLQRVTHRQTVGSVCRCMNIASLRGRQACARYSSMAHLERRTASRGHPHLQPHQIRRAEPRSILNRCVSSRKKSALPCGE